MIIIELFNNLIKFYYILIKKYYNFAIIKINKNINKNTKNILFKNCIIYKNKNDLFVCILLTISIFKLFLIFFLSLRFLISIKYCCKKLIKYLKIYKFYYIFYYFLYYA